MPELPDVEVFRRHLDGTSLHQEIRRTSIEHEQILQDFESMRHPRLTPTGTHFVDGSP